MKKIEKYVRKFSKSSDQGDKGTQMSTGKDKTFGSIIEERKITHRGKWRVWEDD